MSAIALSFLMMNAIAVIINSVTMTIITMTAIAVTAITNISMTKYPSLIR